MSELNGIRPQVCKFGEGSNESIAWTSMEGYYKGPICEPCLGIAMKRHERIIEEKVSQERAKLYGDGNER